MNGLDYYVIDVETTGLKAFWHEISELSVIRVKDKVQLSKDVKCSYPKRANLDSLRITNKSLSDLLLGDTKLTVVNTVNTLFEQDGNTPDGRVIVAYNGAFDRRMLHALWHECGKIFPANLWLDPLQMMRAYAKSQNMGKVSLGLSNACDLMGIKKFAAHKAKGDTRRTYLLYDKLVNEIGMNHLSYIKTERHKVASPVKQIEYSDDDLSLLSEIDF